MTAKEFEKYIVDLQKRFGTFFDEYAPTIAAKTAVDYFKQSFQTESWERVPWKEVKRRMPTWERNGKTIANPYKGAALTRKILTGETGDLGRSIEIDKSRTGNGKAVVWTAPHAFAKSDKIYAAVHNEGLHAGRGKGFQMPKRQFMGESEKLNQLIVDELERKLSEIANK